MRYAEGPSIECHHIPIEQAHQPVPVFRHKCKLGTPLRLSLHDTADHVVLDERQNATADAQRGIL